MKVFALGAGAGLLCLLLHGCVGVSQSPEPAKPFQFRSLTLRQNDEAGEPLWELRSPRSRYQLDNRQAVVTAPVGVRHNQKVNVNSNCFESNSCSFSKIIDCKPTA